MLLAVTSPWLDLFPVSEAVGVPCCCAMAVRCRAAITLVQQEISGKTKRVRAFTMATKPGWLAAQRDKSRSGLHRARWEPSPG